MSDPVEYIERREADLLMRRMQMSDGDWVALARIVSAAGVWRDARMGDATNVSLEQMQALNRATDALTIAVDRWRAG